MQQKNGEHNFVVGQYYKNVEEIQLALDSYNKNKSTDFRIVTNNKRSLIVKCKHGSKLKEIANHNSCNNNNNNNNTNNNNNNTIVIKNFSNNIGCYACITFHKSQKCSDETLKLTKANLSHNHLVRKEWENLENMNFKGKDKEMFLKLRRANAQLSQINSVLIEKKKKKTLTTQRSQRMINYKSTNSENYDKISLEALEEFLGNLMGEADDIATSEKNKNLSDKDKYKIVMPVLNRIGRLITHQPTKQFLGYLEDLSKLETSIHIGQRSTMKIPNCAKELGIKVGGGNDTPLADGDSTKKLEDAPLSANGSDIHVTMKRKTDVEIHHRRDTQSNDISTIDINNFQSSDVSTIELNLRIPSFFSM